MGRVGLLSGRCTRHALFGPSSFTLPQAQKRRSHTKQDKISQTWKEVRTHASPIGIRGRGDHRGNRGVTHIPTERPQYSAACPRRPYIIHNRLRECWLPLPTNRTGGRCSQSRTTRPQRPPLAGSLFFRRASRLQLRRRRAVFETPILDYLCIP